MTRFPLASCLLPIALGSLAPATPPGELPDPVPGQIVIEFDTPSLTPDRLGKTLRTTGASRASSKSQGRLLVLDLPNGLAVQEATSRARSLPGVVHAGPNHRLRLFATPNDPLYSPNQWALNNTGQVVSFRDPSGSGSNINLTGLPDADIDAPEAWDTTTGSSSVVVAIIDTGIAVAHSDLAPNLWTNADEIASNGIDDDNNGYVDDLHGYDFVANTGDPTDVHGHGTFCAGIIGARGNNSQGITGINWSVSLMALKTFSADGTATEADLAEAIDYAIQNGARVINASWGDYYSSPIIASAVERAADAQVLFVAASGNDRFNLKDIPTWPACLDLPNVLSVGATDIRDAWATFSNYDDTYVQIHAPGYWVYSTRPSIYEFASGTSFATPQVAGAAALLLAHEPGIDFASMRHRLVTAGDARASLRGRGSSAARLSAAKLLTAPVTDTVPPADVTDLRVERIASNGLLLAFTAPGDDAGTGQSVLYDARVSRQTITAAQFLSTERVFRLPPPGPGGQTAYFLATGLEPSTTYHLRVLSIDDAGHANLSNEAVATTSGRTVYFTDDAENGTSEWTLTGSFDRTQADAHNGEWSWTDSPSGNYTASTVSTITSSPIDLSTATNPWLTFHHQYLFDRSFTSPGDYGMVQVSTDGTNFTTLAQYTDYMHPWRMARISLLPYAGQPSLRLRFRFRADFSAKVADGWYIDDIEVSQPSSLLPEPADFSVESCTKFTTVNAAPEYIETTDGGSWFTSVSKATLPELRTARSRYNVIDGGSTGSTARFVPFISVAGNYEVFVAWGDYANALNVRHRVYHADGVAESLQTQDHRANSHAWHSLGTFRFEAGRNAESGSVLVDDSTVSGKPDGSLEGRAYADSVRFVYRDLEPVGRDGWLLH